MLRVLLALTQAGSPVAYDVRFSDLAHHEAEITVTFPGLGAGAPLEVWMSRSSPGRYAIHEFAKNVYGVRAEDGRGRPLTFTRPNPYSWRIAGHDGTVRVRYTLFGDRGDGTYAQITRSHAHLNAPATFLWARGLEDRPVRVAFQDLPPGWRIATQLKPTGDAAVFTAPNLQLFLDSPITLGPIDLRTWPVVNGNRADTIRLAILHRGTTEEVDRFVEMIKRVVPEQAAVFGELPNFDWGTYTFLAVYLPWASGDGMEHRNSTSLTTTRPLSAGMLGHLGTVSHEFFHAWNVERIRPRSLEPFDFTGANMSGELWLAEGFTNYYGGLVLRRAGFLTDEEYFRNITGAIRTILQAPGRGLFSAVDMSRQAPFADQAAFIDVWNQTNTFISYYTFGEGLGLALDLTIRSRFPGLTLDDFMRGLWLRHGRTERPYTLDDVRITLGEVTKDPAFADDFFRRYITGREAADYTALLATVGLVLRPARPGAAWMGEGFTESATGLILGSTRADEPRYRAGLAPGDTLLTLDGRAVASRATLDSVLTAHRPGDTLAVTYAGRGARMTGRVILAEHPALEVVPAEVAGVALNASALEARRRWLASRAGTQGAPR